MRCPLAILGITFGVMTVSGCATTSYLPRLHPEAFQAMTTSPSVHVVSPRLHVSANFGPFGTTRESLTPHVKEAHHALLQAFMDEFRVKGYQVSGALVDDEEVPRDPDEERLREVVNECYEEFGLMGAALLRNLAEEDKKPLDYRLGRRAEELAQQLPERPRYLFFAATSGYTTGLLPISESPTPGRVLVALLGSGWAPDPVEYLHHTVALIDTATGDVVWFNNWFEGSASILYPGSRTGTVQHCLKELPPPGGGAT